MADNPCRNWEESALYEDRRSEEIWADSRRETEEIKVSAELERLETLERHGMLTHSADQNALEELRQHPGNTGSKPKKAPAKKAAKKPPAKKVSNGEAK